ncbi:hypothetical protein [Maribacter sp. R77961]|uniref:hypothetical protein n=1 Tax=Maribacter sp. R77961 TaxID=3093871 RepID=UPI0037C87528
MKKLSLYFLTIATVFFTSCESDDKVVIGVIDGITSSAILRTRSIESGTFNRFDTSSIFSVTVEQQDEENGTLLSSVDVLVSFTDNKDDGVDNSKAEVAYTTIPASEFSTSERGLPQTNFTATLAEALAAVGLVDGQFDGGDTFRFRFVVNLTNGTSWSAANGNGNITGGSYFSSPYQYTAGVACIPVTPVAGTYNLDMEDTYGDGWDGAFFTVSIDGDTTDYTIESGSAANFDIVVPDGTEELTFTYTPGNFEEEHIWELTAPTGETAAAGSPGPGGDIVLNICN